ncbi:MAG: alpha/beta hydrolase [Lautropia sp.]|nr:alpha/beta hydrolase [Lautropia sp.]
MSSTLLEVLDAVERRYRWQSLVVDGHEWRWLDTATAGPVAILLPGSLGDAGMFAVTLSSLGEQARLIAVTYPAVSEPGALADGLAALMDHLAIEAAAVVGSSFAAWWSQYFALKYPRRVAALVIGNGFVEGKDLADNPLFDREQVSSISAQTLHGQWLERVRASPVTPLQQLQHHMLADRQSPASLMSRLLGVINALPCPPLTLPQRALTVLDCDDDPLIPLPVRERFRMQYPQARHVTLPSGGHYPHLLNSAAYEALLLEVLTRSTKGDSK